MTEARKQAWAVNTQESWITRSVVKWREAPSDKAAAAKWATTRLSRRPERRVQAEWQKSSTTAFYLYIRTCDNLLLYFKLALHKMHARNSNRKCTARSLTILPTSTCYVHVKRTQCSADEPTSDQTDREIKRYHDSQKKKTKSINVK